MPIPLQHGTTTFRADAGRLLVPARKDLMLRSLDRRLVRYSRYAPTALRVALGAVFVAHALGKAFVFTFPGTESYFAANGFPTWTVYPVFAAELLGGLALLAGFRVRAVALALVPVMLGAMKPHLGNGWFFASSGGGWEYPAFLIVALIAQALLGAGAFAFDPTLAEAPCPAPGKAAHTMSAS
jgi:putative oxidoreductase